MLTGFNTDIQHNGIVYHVQTEDKGPENPLMLSLVYVGGAILAAKRTNYAKDLEAGLGEAELQSKLEKQHKLILALISRGRIDDLIKAREREIQAERGQTEAPPPPTLPPVETPAPPTHAPGTQLLTSLMPPALVEFIEKSVSGPLPPMPPPPPPPTGGSDRMPGVTEMLSPVLSMTPNDPQATPPSGGGFTSSLDLLVRQIAGEPFADTDPQPGRVNSGPLSNRSSGGFNVSREFDLDRIISEYLQTDAKEEKPDIRLRGETNFFAGDTVNLEVEVSRGPDRLPVTEAPVIVKILGTAFKPQTHSTITGADGIAYMTLTLPNFTAGSAAIVVQTTSEAGESELKHLIRRR